MVLGSIRELSRASAGFPAPGAQLALRPRDAPVTLGSRLETAPLDELVLRAVRGVLGNARRDYPHVAAHACKDRDDPPQSTLPLGFTAEIGAVAHNNGKTPFPDPLTVTKDRQ